MGYSVRMEDKNAEKSMEAWLMRFQNGTKNWARGYLCDILAKNLTSFCLYPENLSKTEFKDKGLLCSAKVFK